MVDKGALIRVRQQMDDRFAEKVDDLTKFRAIIGDGEGTVFTDATRTDVFIRRIGRGRIEKCQCTRVSARNNLRVWVGYAPENPKTLQVLDVDEAGMQARDGYTYMGHHHQAHEKDNAFGGDDVVWVRENQFLPLLMQPTDPPSMGVAIHPGRYRYRRTWHQWPGSLNIGDLSGFIPIAANRAVMVLFMVAAGSTNLVAQSSQEFFASTAEEWRIYFTPDPLQDCVPIASIFFYNDMTEITWNEIYDMRLFLEAFYCSCGSGGEGDPHDLLSPTHQDTFTGGPVCGDLVIAWPEDSPYWRRLPVGANGSILTNDGTYTDWSTYFLFGSGGQSYTFSSSTGTVPTIPVAVTANQVAYYNTGAAAVTLTGSDEFVYTGGKLGVGRNAPVGHLDVYDATINTTAPYYGIYNYHVKTLGATDFLDVLEGIYNYVEFDQNGAVIGNFTGIRNSVVLTSGDVGDGGARSMVGIYNYVWMEDATCEVTEDVYGAYTYVDLNGGVVGDDVVGHYIYVNPRAGMTSIGGDVYGIRLYLDADQDPVGSVYSIYWEEGANVDYGIYQSGSALNVWGGSHSLVDGAWIGIAGNELLTVNAAGTFAFSGITGITVEDGDWIGIGPAAERIEYYTAGYVSVMGARLGVETATPGYILETDPGNVAGSASFLRTGTAVGGDQPIQIRLERQTVAASALGSGDQIAAISLYGPNDAGGSAGIEYGRISLWCGDDTAGSEGGIISIEVMQAGVRTRAVTIDDSSNVGINETSPNRRQHTREISAINNAVIPVARFESEVSGGAGAAGHGPALEFYGETSTTTSMAMGMVSFTWKAVAHPSRYSQFEVRTWYIGNKILSGVVVAPTHASAAGNMRGAGAVDWQGYRTAATQVASGVYAVLGGGYENTVSGNIATVPGGYSCLASGPNSFATGYDAHATHAQSFVLSATNAQTVSWAANTFTVRSHGGTRFYSAAGVGTGVQLTAGGNAWAGISARAAKENFRSVEGILDKIAFLPIYNYNLKSQAADVRHIGPVAEDFNEIFGFTEAPLRINMSDFAGVGLAGVQALHAEVLALRERVQVLEVQLVD